MPIQDILVCKTATKSLIILMDSFLFCFIKRKGKVVYALKIQLIGGI